MPFALPLGPGAVQSVLQNRELVGVVAYIVDQPGKKNGADFSATDRDGTGNRSSPLLTGETGNQVLPLIHRFGKTGKARAISQKVGAHRQDYVNRVFRFGGFQQQIHERNRCLLGSMRLARGCGSLRRFVTEKLLELIDDQQQILLITELGLLEKVDQAEVAHSQSGLDHVLQCLPADVETAKHHSRLGQGSRQGLNRISAGPELSHPPCRASAGHPAPAQSRPQAAVHQRGLSAARGPNYRQKALDRQLVDHHVNLALPAKEKVFLIFAKRPQAGEGIGKTDAGGGAHAVAPLPSSPLINLSISVSEKPCNPLIRFGSSSSISSRFDSVVGSAR